MTDHAFGSPMQDLDGLNHFEPILAKCVGFTVEQSCQPKSNLREKATPNFLGFTTISTTVTRNKERGCLSKSSDERKVPTTKTMKQMLL